MKTTGFILSFIFLVIGCTTADAQERNKRWEEANKYRASITDTTFLQTRGKMSYAAIDPFTGEGSNKNYAFNQVVYLKALQRAQKRLSVVNNQLECDVRSGKEIHISEDLYQFIMDLFKEWNTWLKSGKFEIGKDEHGLYTVLPKKENIWNLGIAKITGEPITDLSTIEVPQWAKWNNPEEYCIAQMKYPPQMLKKNQAGYAVVMFSLDTLGIPRVINILSASHKDFAKETVRLIKELPHCLPCRDKEGKRMECWYTVHVPFLPQQYKNRIKADSIAEEELKQCFVEWETQAQFQGRDGNKVADYVYQHLSYDAKRLDKQQKVKGLYIVKIDSYGEIKEANILQSCGIQEWDEKVVRIIRDMPRWSPATSYYGKGEYKNATWAIPVIFENK